MPRDITQIALASMENIRVLSSGHEYKEPGVAVAVLCADGTAWLRMAGEYRFAMLPAIETEQELLERKTREKRETEEAHADPSRLPLDDCYCEKCRAAVEVAS